MKAQKNDDGDAEAIAEAASRPTVRFVTLKTEGQLDMQSVHRVRQRLVGVRRTLVSQLRAILFERGISVAQACVPLTPSRSQQPWQDGRGCSAAMMRMKRERTRSDAAIDGPGHSPTVLAQPKASSIRLRCLIDRA